MGTCKGITPSWSRSEAEVSVRFSKWSKKNGGVECAIKCVQMTEDTKHVLREDKIVDILKDCRHSNVVKLLDVWTQSEGSFKTTFYIEMELCNEALRDRLDRDFYKCGESETQSEKTCQTLRSLSMPAASPPESPTSIPRT